jgi:Flp pilus assembly protein TadG
MSLPSTAKSRFQKASEPESGQAMVEFMLVISVVFILFVSMLQTMILMHSYNTLADAAKEGVRYAIVHGTGLTKATCSGPGNPAVSPALTCTDSAGANVQTAVTNFAGLSLQSVPASDVTVCYDPNSTTSPPTCTNGANTNNSAFGAPCSAAGCLVRVTVSHSYTPLFGLGWPTITLNAAADGRIMN